MTGPSTITRRRLLQNGLAAGAVGAVGAPLLSGCSNEGRGTGGSQADNDAVQLPDHIPYRGVQPDLVGEDGVSDGMLAYPADPVQASDGAPGDGEPVSAMAHTNTPAPPGLDDNEFWQALNERLGLTLSLSLVPAPDWPQRFQTTVAGDQLPDLFTVLTGNIPSLPPLLAEKAVDLTPLLSGEAVAAYPFLANLPTESWAQTVFNGKIFGVPVPRGPQTSTVLYGRQDTLAERGLEQAPESFQDLYDRCAEVTSESAGRWALGGAPLVVVRQMFQIPNVWSEQDGRLVHANEAEQQQDALEAVRKLVAAGFLHPDAFGVEQPQRKIWVANGTTSYIEDTFSAWTDFYNFPIPAGFRLAAYAPPLAAGGGVAALWLGGPMSNLTAINIRSEARAEALLSVLNYLAAPFGTAEHLFRTYGLEGVHHELEGTDPVLTEKGRSETQLSLKYLAEGPWTNFQAGLPEVTQDQFDAQSAVVPQALANPTMGLYSETQSRRGGQIGGVIGSLESDIMQGREPVSAWDDAVATWKRNGGDAIRDELQTALEVRRGG